MPRGYKVATVDVTQENLHQIVSENNLVIVDFWAPWCGPCRSFAPAYEAASEKYPDVVFAKVNTEEQQALAGYFQIRSIPTLMIFREKIIIFAQPGALPASALDQVIEKAKALDMDEVRRDIETQSKADKSA
jgi:thioredoxin 1